MPIAKLTDTYLCYEEQGQGEPLLLLPGLGMGRSYYRLATPLLSRQFRVITVDPRGIGESDRTVRPFTAEMWADDFAALMSQLRLDRVHVLGSSHGGCMAMAMALRHPALVRSLTLVGAFSELDRLMELNFQYRKKLVQRHGMGEELAGHIGLWTMGRRFLETEAAEAVLRGNETAVKANSPETYVALLDSILHWGRRLPGQRGEPTVTTQLHRIDCPVLALTGDDDHFIPSSFSRRIVDQVPNGTYLEIPGCGHIPFLEQPGVAAEAVQQFITRAGAGAGAR